MVDNFSIIHGFNWHHFCHKVLPNDIGIGKCCDILGTGGISICLSVTLYDGVQKKGALSHITGFDEYPEELFPENIVDTMISKLGVSSSCYGRLEASLFGEGILFGENSEKSCIVRRNFQDYGIPIIGEDLGKSFGRLGFLYCDSGNVEVRRTNLF